MLIKVDNNSIRRMKTHMHEFFKDPSVGCILGTNGYIWIYSLNQDSSQVEVEERRMMAMLRNSILVLEKAKIPIFKDTINEVLSAVFDTELEPKQILSNYEELAKGAKEMIDKEIALKKPIDFNKMLE